jgi:hypothetical protein
MASLRERHSETFLALVARGAKPVEVLCGLQRDHERGRTPTVVALERRRTLVQVAVSPRGDGESEHAFQERTTRAVVAGVILGATCAVPHRGAGGDKKARAKARRVMAGHICEPAKPVKGGGSLGIRVEDIAAAKWGDMSAAQAGIVAARAARGEEPILSATAPRVQRDGGSYAVSYLAESEARGEYEAMRPFGLGLAAGSIDYQRDAGKEFRLVAEMKGPNGWERHTTYEGTLVWKPNDKGRPVVREPKIRVTDADGGEGTPNPAE